MSLHLDAGNHPLTPTLLPTDWILRYTATAHLMAMVRDEPLSLNTNSTFALPESDALSLLALFQRRGRSHELLILHRPKGIHVR